MTFKQCSVTAALSPLLSWSTLLFRCTAHWIQIFLRFLGYCVCQDPSTELCLCTPAELPRWLVVQLAVLLQCGICEKLKCQHITAAINHKAAIKKRNKKKELWEISKNQFNWGKYMRTHVSILDKAGILFVSAFELSKTLQVWSMVRTERKWAGDERAEFS